MKLELINYTDKSIAVFGETYPIKEQLKQLGGKFNKYLVLNGEKKAGWVFGKKAEPKIQAIIKQKAKVEPKKSVSADVNQSGNADLCFQLGVNSLSLFSLADIYFCEYFKRQDIECLDDAIALELNGVCVSLKSFERYSDKNLITNTLAKRYLRKTGAAIDSIVELVESHGYICNPDDVVAYMVANPSGRPLKNQRMKLACDTFREMYKRELNITVAKDLLKLKEQAVLELKAVSAANSDSEFFTTDDENPF